MMTRQDVCGQPAEAIRKTKRGPDPLPDSPTNHQPGSPEKVDEMCRRAAQRRPLFHPLDRRRC
jgi:hypothetical protein